MTKYIDLRENKTPLEGVTRFDKYVDNDSVVKPTLDPSRWDIIALIGVESEYGAVFKANNGGSLSDSVFAIYFGHAGAEFNQ